MKKILPTQPVHSGCFGSPFVCAQPSHAGFGISPRVALPLGDFGDTVGMGFGASVVTDTPVRGGLSFLTFGEGDFGSATAMGLFAGYERQVGGVDVKIDANLMRITTEIEVFGISVEETETKIKITPGVSYTMGKLPRLTTICSATGPASIYTTRSANNVEHITKAAHYNKGFDRLSGRSPCCVLP